MELHRRRTPRLQHYDYSRNGAYFITICTQDRKCLFGGVGADSISARMVAEVWVETLEGFSGVSSEKYVVMPNHFHAIVLVERADPPSAPTISAVVQAFKRYSTIRYIGLVRQGSALPFDKRIWQRSFHDHVIRGEQDYLRIWEYIDNNPARWAEDMYYEEGTP